MARLDLNNDGFISREDFELMAKKLTEQTKYITKEQVESTFKIFLKIADDLGLKPGVKIGLEEAAKTTSEVILSKILPKPERPSEVHDMLFNAIDTNNDGHISVEEFKVYFHVIGHNISEEEIASSFNTIDVNKNGVISRGEFVAVAQEFFFGLEETEISNAFYGKLLP